MFTLFVSFCLHDYSLICISPFPFLECVWPKKEREYLETIHYANKTVKELFGVGWEVMVAGTTITLLI